jgi:flagellar protein FlaG
MVDPVIPRIQDASSVSDLSKVVAEVKESRSVKDQPKQQKQVSENKKSSESSSEKSSRDPKSEPLTLEQVEQEVEQLNLALGSNTNLQFRIGDATGKLVVEVVDKASGNVIKTIPRDEIKNVASKLRLGSFLIDKKS